MRDFDSSIFFPLIQLHHSSWFLFRGTDMTGLVWQISLYCVNAHFNVFPVSLKSTEGTVLWIWTDVKSVVSMAGLAQNFQTDVGMLQLSPRYSRNITMHAMPTVQKYSMIVLFFQILQGNRNRDYMLATGSEPLRLEVISQQTSCFDSFWKPKLLIILCWDLWCSSGVLEISSQHHSDGALPAFSSWRWFVQRGSFQS